jgi:Ala-tRNA(Pro) deacylase
MTIYEKIINILKENNISYESFTHEAVRTSEEAAKVRNTSLKEGAKALVMIADGIPVLIIVPGDTKADTDKIKNIYKYNKLKMSSIEEAQRLSGAQVGGVPPFGNLFEIPVKMLCAKELLENEFISFNAGEKTISIRMKSKEWFELVNPDLY